MATIKPKLQGQNNDFRDFIIENNNGFINLIGIESPDLNVSLFISKYINQLI